MGGEVGDLVVVPGLAWREDGAGGRVEGGGCVRAGVGVWGCGRGEVVGGVVAAVVVVIVVVLEGVARG